MGKTYRDIPDKKWNRTPKYKGKIVGSAGGKGDIVTDWDDAPIAGRRENKWKVN